MAALMAYMSKIAACYNNGARCTTRTHLEHDHHSKPSGCRAVLIAAEKITTKVTSEADNQRIADNAAEAHKLENR